MPVATGKITGAFFWDTLYECLGAVGKEGVAVVQSGQNKGCNQLNSKKFINVILNVPYLLKLKIETFTQSLNLIGHGKSLVKYYTENSDLSIGSHCSMIIKLTFGNGLAMLQKILSSLQLNMLSIIHILDSCILAYDESINIGISLIFPNIYNCLSSA